VRQALQLATPKRQIVDELLKGGRASVAVAHVSLGPFADQAAGPSPYEPSRAAALLDEAGWKPGADGVRVKEGKRLELTVSSTPEKHRELTQQLLQSVWRKIGVDLKIKNYPSSTLLGSWSRNGIRGRGRFDLIMFAASAPVDPLGYYATRFTAAGIPSEKNPGGYNFNGYSNPKVEALVAQASSEVDRATRRELYLQISRILNADVETILLYNRAEASVYSARLQGLVMHPWENLAWNIADWSFRQ
jgi:peptide/nickel transport system substrate-binding protein